MYIDVKIIDQLSVSVTWDMVDMLHDMMYGEGLYLPINCITCHCLKWRYTEPRFLHLPSPSRIASTLGGPRRPVTWQME